MFPDSQSNAKADAKRPFAYVADLEMQLFNAQRKDGERFNEQKDPLNTFLL